MQVDQLLLKMPPRDLSDYVLGNGWTLSDRNVSGLFVLNSPDRKRQLLLPRDSSAPDYFDAARIFLQKVSEIENLPSDVVLQRLESLRDDTIRIRIEKPMDESDSISLRYAQSVIKSTENMLMAAACSVVQPQLYHPRLSRSEAQQIVEAADFGHTERGSFVINVSCPLNAVPTNTPLFAGTTETTFTREAIDIIFSSATRIVKAIEDGRSQALVDEESNAEKPTISANMCYAIAGLCKNAPGENIDLEIDWSRTLNKIDYKKDRDSCRIPTSIHDHVTEIGRLLYEVKPDPSQTYLGTVEQLYGKPTEDGRRAGDVVIAILMHDGRRQRARVTLNADQYQDAIKAHSSADVFVSIRGTLNPGRQPRIMVDLSEFSLV